jgi:hypothetical protein
VIVCNRKFPIPQLPLMGQTIHRRRHASVCVVDDTGKIIREVKVASEPEALLAVLKNPAYHFKRIGLEAGPLSQWLFSAFAEAELPVVCVETRHMQAVLKAQINKTDRNDARGIAQMMRVRLYRPVHVKTLRSQKLRMLLTHRKLLQSKAIAIENDLRGTLRNFGLKVGMIGKVRFEARIRELVENLPDLGQPAAPPCRLPMMTSHARLASPPLASQTSNLQASCGQREARRPPLKSSRLRHSARASSGGDKESRHWMMSPMRLHEIERGDGFFNRLLIGFSFENAAAGPQRQDLQKCQRRLKAFGVWGCTIVYKRHLIRSGLILR